MSHHAVHREGSRPSSRFSHYSQEPTPVSGGEQDPTDAEAPAHQDTGYLDLIPVTGPILKEPKDYPTITSVTGKLPTVGIRKLLSRDDLERRDTACGLGELYLDRAVTYARLSRTATRRFTQELQLLNNLLHYIFRKVHF